MKNIKAPFKWAGSKTRLYDSYKDILFPDNVDTFVDLFTGSTTISMWIREMFPDARIILNDRNEELIGMYFTIKNNYENFEREYEKIVNEFLPLDKEGRKAFYYSIRDSYTNDYEVQSGSELYSKLFFMLQTCFNGLWKVYKKCNGRYSTPPGTLMNSDKFFSLDKPRKFHEFLRTCELSCKDFSEMNDSYAGDVFYYADPPYRDSVVEYKDAFSEQDQKNLVSFLRDRSDEGCYVAESNKEIGDDFWNIHFGPGYSINEVEVKYTAGRGTSIIQAREVLITNYVS